MYPSLSTYIALQAFPTIKEAIDATGIDAVELEYYRDNCVRSLTSPTGDEKFALDSPDGIDAFREHLKANSARVAALVMHNNLGSDDLAGEVAWAVKAVNAAAALGIKAVRIDAIMHGEMEFTVKRNAEVFAEAMSRVLDATPDTTVDMGIENHGYQGNNPEFLDLVLEKVGSPRVGMTIDTGNFYWRGYPLSRVYEIIEHFAPYCKHTHAKNIAYPVDKREIEREMGWEYMTYASPLAEGDIDHRRVVSILKTAGYDRDLCIEDESMGRWTPENRKEVLKKDAEFFKEILKA